jgi:hypothetical protein
MSTWQHTGFAIKGAGESGGIFVRPGDSGSIDAFARFRTSEPFSLFDSKQIWDDSDIANSAENYPLFYDNQETAGSGTSTTFNVNRAITGIIGAIVAGNTKRLGYFDENDGLFFESNGTNVSVAVRSNVSGSPINTSIAQSDWNLDPMDGSGPSGINLDFSKVQIFVVDFEWLGVGRVRFGFFVDGLPVYCHQVLNANVITSVYMSNPNLPIRIEIDNDGTGAIDSIEHICTTVVSEGGVQPNGVIRSEDIGTLATDDIAAAAPGTVYAVCGIRLKTNYLSADIRETFISLIENSGANNPFLWKLHFNPTVTTSLVYADVANSAVQFAPGDGTTPANNVITDDGTVIASGYQARQDANANVPLDSALRLGSLIDGTRDELVLSGTPITNNQLYFGGLSWREAW